MISDQFELLKNKIPKSIESDLLDYYIMTEEDTETVVKLRNAKHVRDNYIYKKIITHEEHNNYYKTQVESGNTVQYVIKEKFSNNAIGCVFLKNINLVKKSAEYGVFIGDKNVLGKGYGKDTLNQMKKLAFTNLGLKELTLRVLSYNEIARKMYKKAGFEEVNREIKKNTEDGSVLEIIHMIAVNEG